MGLPHTGVWMFEGLSMQHFLIDGLDAMTNMLATTFTGSNTDFFLWGYMNDHVFATPVNDIGEHKPESVT